MWHFFGFMRSKNKSPSFADQANLAIRVFHNHGVPETTEGFIDILTSHGIKKSDAIEMYLFLPIAFVRVMLPMINWGDNYVDMEKNGTRIPRKFSKTTTYQDILNETRKYVANNPKTPLLLQIGGRSSEFNGMNQLMLKNPDLEIGDIKFTDTVLIR